MNKTQMTLCMCFLSYLNASQASAHAIDSLERQSKALAIKTEIEAQKASMRWTHAQELLGQYSQESIVKAGQEIVAIDKLITQVTKRALKGKWKKKFLSISNIIIRESNRYGFDPLFLMAVIENESSFQPDAIGPIGEIGLMQLSPQTAEWIAKKCNLPWKGLKSLKDPRTNIQIGSAYLSYLREKFDFRSQLYLAAYNMGSTNVQKYVDKQVWPKEYSGRVMQRYLRLYTELKNTVNKSVN